MKHSHTSDLAKALGYKSNTVLRYVNWSLLPLVERSPSRYCRLTCPHLDCHRLARRVYSDQKPSQEA